jgi:hypothetical protein
MVDDPDGNVILITAGWRVDRQCWITNIESGFGELSAWKQVIRLGIAWTSPADFFPALKGCFVCMVGADSMSTRFAANPI